MAIVGVDIGATKTHVAVVFGAAEPIECVVPSGCWRGHNYEDNARSLLSLIRKTAPAEYPTVLVVGAHGCDDAARCLTFQRCLAALNDWAVLVVNDAELLVPAAGFDRGIGVVAGTGSIAVARLPDCTMLVAGGWGWLLGDEGGAVGLVREAVRAVRRALDSGESTDPLIVQMQLALGTDDPIQFGQKLLEAGGAATIGAHVSAVVAAAEMGSRLASGVVREGGAALARLVEQLVGRGAGGGHIVAGGSVIVHQGALMASFRESIAASLPGWQITLLARAPVYGALALARQIEAGQRPFGLAPALPPGWRRSVPSRRSAEAE
jgi:N-acetylglucosamine kinase-like BadF-type ATPase